MMTTTLAIDSLWSWATSSSTKGLSPLSGNCRYLLSSSSPLSYCWALSISALQAVNHRLIFLLGWLHALESLWTVACHQRHSWALWMLTPVAQVGEEPAGTLFYCYLRVLPAWPTGLWLEYLLCTLWQGLHQQKFSSASPWLCKDHCILGRVGPATGWQIPNLYLNLYQALMASSRVISYFLSFTWGQR